MLFTCKGAILKLQINLVKNNTKSIIYIYIYIYRERERERERERIPLGTIVLLYSKNI